MITVMNESDDIKLSLRLTKTCFFLLLYIHCTACVWFFCCNIYKEWKPAPFVQYGLTNDIYDAETPIEEKYLVSFYLAIIALTGNDLYPKDKMLFAVSSVMVIAGALMNANLFGSVSSILQQINRKGNRLQEQIDTANTSMKNMKLPSNLQRQVREFMTVTYNHLDNQKELDKFLEIISPSLRQLVTQHILLDAIDKNTVFKGKSEIMDFIINDVQTLLYYPEDTIISQGEEGETFFFLAKGGKC